MGAVTVPLLSDFAWHGESFGNSCLTTRNHSLLYEAMCTWFGFTQLLPLLAKRRDQTHLTDSGPTAVTTTWSAGSLPPKMHWWQIASAEALVPSDGRSCVNASYYCFLHHNPILVISRSPDKTVQHNTISYTALHWPNWTGRKCYYIQHCID